MSKMCDRCGRAMEDGSLAYEVRIQVAADFDGTLTVEPAMDAGRALHDLVASAARRDPDELMRDVYHSEKHLLCPCCRDRYLANPLNIPLRADFP